MLVETLYVGRDNVFSLRLMRDGEAINLLAILGYSLHLSNGRVFADQERFVEKPGGVVEIAVGDLLTEADVGSHRAYLVTTDPVNVAGVRWPDFKLKVRA